MPRKRGSGRVSKTVNSSANTVTDALKRGSGRGRRGRPPLNAKASRMEADIVGGQKIEENNSAPTVVPAFISMVARTVSESEPGDLPGYLHKKFKKVAAPIQNDAQIQGSPVTVESVTNVAALPSASEVTLSVKSEKNGGEAVVVAIQAAEEESESAKKGTGKYVCPICQHACAKPSVLEKHLRAHTNERPYPCTPCGFAFKTKSNLYKHCKSRAHVLKLESLGQAAPTMTDICFSGTEDGATDEEDSEDLAALSDASSTSQLSQQQKAGQHTPFKHSVASMLNHATEATPPKVTAPEGANKETRLPGAADFSTKAATPDRKLYKPKFRGVGNEEANAVVRSSQVSPTVPTTVATNVANDFENLSCATWARVTPSSSASSSSSLTPPTSSSYSLYVTSSAATVVSSVSMIARSLPSPGSLQARISQIISDNEAIVETRDPVWAKRFLRQTSKDKSISRALVLTTTPSGPDEVAKHNRERSSSFSVARLEESRSSPVIQYSGKNAPPSQGHGICNALAASEDLHRKRCHSEGPVASQSAALSLTASPAKIPRFENRPESYPGADLSNAIMAASGASYNPKLSQGSIIKDLLLMNRSNHLSRDETDQAARATSLPAPVSSHGDYQKYYRSNSMSSNSSSSSAGGVRTCTTESESGVLNLSISRLTAVPVRPTSSQSSTSTNNVSLIPLHEQRNSVLVANLGSNWPALRSHEDLNASQPSKSTSLQLFGGQVQICDGNEKRILRIDATGVTPDDKTGEQAKVAYDTSSTLLVSIANSGLNSGGGIVQVQEKVVRSSAAGQVVSSAKPALTGASRNFFLPTTNFDPSLSIIPVTKAVPHPPEVPGMPGPATQHRIPEITVQSPPPCTTSSERAAISTMTVSTTSTVTTTTTEGGSKFLRPNTLPLKPGTFLPRKISMTGMDHLGTPTLSGPGMTLVSPETPRPRKSYSQNYLNGHAYTYLGLKCSTRVYYCCLSRPQPMYVLQSCDQKLSMYSQWQTRPIPADASPCGLRPTQVMSLYDSRHRPRNATVAQSNNPMPLLLTHSSYWLHRDRANRASEMESERRNLASGLPGNPQVPLSNSADPSVNSAEPVVKKEEDAAEKSSDVSEIQSVLPKRVRIFAGGFKSNEDYTYVRGRGRGRYVCEECGIRCKKPSMLKKHIRTHTDVRPYTCRQCCFSFKTKGNLTKHMKSKAHHKKCTDLGIVPVPTAVEDCNIDEESVAKQESLRKLKAQLGEGDSDNDFDDEEDEDDEEEDEEDDEEEDQFEDADETEREVARSLLDLQSACSLPDALQNAKAAADAGLIAPLGIKPNTYPYVGGPELAQSLRDTVSDTKDNSITTTATEAVSSSASFPRYYFPAKSPRLDETTTVSISTQNIPETTLAPSLPSPSPSTSVSASVTTATVTAPATLGVTTSGQSDMLQIYLTEKAVKEVEIKRKQWNEILGSPDMNSRPIGGAETVSDAVTSHVAASVALSGPNLILVSDDGKVSNPGLVPFPKVEITPNDSLSSNAMEVCEEMQVPTDMMRAQTSVPLVIAEGTSGKPRAEFLLPSSAAMVPTAYRVTDDGKTACSICNKVFSKPSQLRLHINIHYFERPFRCDACAVSFRTKGHLQKHKRSVSHFNKVNMNLTFGTPSTENPRPFKCSDCLIAFRIHGHLAKHLRSKMHIMKLECLGKLPFGTYAEMERSGMNLNEIDTTDCQNSLESLQSLAHRLYRQDPSKLQQWQAEVHRNRTISGSSEDLDEVDDGDVEAEAEDGEDSDGAPCPEPLPDPCPDIERSLEHRSKVWPGNHVLSREIEDKVPSAPSKSMQYMLDHSNGFTNSRQVSVQTLTQHAVTSSSPQRSLAMENHAHLKPSELSVSVAPGSSVIRGPGSDVTAIHARGPPPRSHSALEIRQLVTKPRYEYPPEMDKASACLCSACGEVCADNEAFRKHVLLKHPPQAPVPNSSSAVNSNSTSTSTVASQSNTPSVPHSFMSASSSTLASPATTSVTTLWNPLTHKPSKPPDNWYSTYQRSENSRVRLSLDFPAPTSFSLNLSRVPSDVNYAELNPTWVKEQQTMLAYMASRAGALSPRSQMMRNESFPSVGVATTSVSCDLCGKQGMNPLELKQHLSSHAQPRPFVCEFCDAGFTTRQSLENHILFHKRQSLS